MDSFMAWVGGKKLLRNEIVNRFPKDFKRYVEVFGGAGWVLFHKECNGEMEVYNDINSDLVNLFKCVKHHPEALQQEMDYLLNARQIFQDYRSQMLAEGLTDIQRAVRYLYIIRASYGAKLETYGIKTRNMANVKNLDGIKERLARVVIENKGFEELISAHDKTDTFFYLDPPYYGTEKMYDTGSFVFNEEQHRRLRDMLASIKGKFLLSYNDDVFIRELYQNFKIEEVSRNNNLAVRVGANKMYNELIIRNYE